MSEFIVGIDLGTTNCAASYCQKDGEGLEDLQIQQLVHAGELEGRSTLPSYLYLPGRHELPAGALSLPWDEVAEFAVGTYARDEGIKVPDRLISSAKSWLSQEGVDRRSPILPWKSPDEVPRQSPVEAEANYLRHLVNSWRFSKPGSSLEKQEVILTVPASFDAVARELTAEAARKAGLENLTLLEEPQAAFYAWLAAAGEDWRKQVGVGERILVCDIGGGTSDFTLIVVSQQEGDLSLERVAVGDHILLGGDNMDLALAYTVQTRLKGEGTKLDSWQFQVLTHGCRVAKEALLGAEAVESAPLTIPGRGSKLIGGSIQTELLRADVEKALLDGFLPVVKPTDHAQRSRRLGLGELGLPYESDPAISKHLARFLSAAGGHPTAILFNGGVCKAPLIRERILEILNGWLKADKAAPLKVLEGNDPDLAVARGAAHYGLVRQGKGIRIRGGTSRSYYIGVEVARPAIPGVAPPTKAVCVAPKGMEEGTSADLVDQEFGLVLGETVEFPFLTSTVRGEDPVGAVIEDWEDEDEIERIATVTSRLATEEPGERIVPVRLQSLVTEIGTLELWCLERDGEGRWKLEFEVRHDA